MFKELSAAINADGNTTSLPTLLSPILRACEAFDAAGNADGTALCVCEAYFVTRSIALQARPLLLVTCINADIRYQISAMISSSITGAPPSKMVSKALKFVAELPQ
jgi:hypothetical protein